MRIDDRIKKYPPAFMDSFIDENGHIIEAVANYIENQDNVTPPIDKVWDAFHLVSFDRYGLFRNSLKVVIMLQDPYPTPGTAMGVALATTNGTIQPSLANFHRRIKETGHQVPDLRSGDIRGLAAQGVLLLNASLTTVTGEINAHTDVWDLFTTQLVKWLTKTFPFLVFVFMGRNAARYGDYVTDKNRHPIIETSHPSGRGYHYGFHECDIFNQVNEQLTNHGREPIDWCDLHYV